MQRVTVRFITCLIIASFAFASCAERKEEVSFIQEKKPLAGAAKKSSLPSDKPITEELVLFSFERNADGWEVPDWVLEKDDYVGETAEVSQDVASDGNSALKLNCDFSDGAWTAALVELEQYLDFAPYREISVDVYIPKETPLGLRARIILTVGEEWKFTEMTRAIPLMPGEWISIRANIEPGSYDWKRTVPDKSFRADIRKLALRIESNRKPVYKGPVYIDNVKICK